VEKGSSPQNKENRDRTFKEESTPKRVLLFVLPLGGIVKREGRTSGEVPEVS